jgi:hypothetical protein
MNNNKINNKISKEKNLKNKIKKKKFQIFFNKKKTFFFIKKNMINKYTKFFFKYI